MLDWEGVRVIYRDDDELYEKENAQIWSYSAHLQSTIREWWLIWIASMISLKEKMILTLTVKLWKGATRMSAEKQSQSSMNKLKIW